MWGREKEQGNKGLEAKGEHEGRLGYRAEGRAHRAVPPGGCGGALAAGGFSSSSARPWPDSGLRCATGVAAQEGCAAVSAGAQQALRALQGRQAGTL